MAMKASAMNTYAKGRWERFGDNVFASGARGGAAGLEFARRLSTGDGSFFAIATVTTALGAIGGVAKGIATELPRLIHDREQAHGPWDATPDEQER